MMTNEDRIQTIERLGYTRREAAFLCLVALHSGFYLRRQYRRFAVVEAGRSDDHLATKVINLNHGSSIAGKANTLVYHLCSRSFYNAIGQPDNRHRRMRTRLAIKAKLMALDHVLAHPDARYLATEEEKLDYFLREVCIAELDLPVKTYRSETSLAVTTRYFIDKFPIAILSEASSSPPVVTFSYIDEGAIATPGFENWLGQYARLFIVLDRFRVDYVTTPAFPGAERTFHRFHGDSDRIPDALDRVAVDKLLTFFRLEHLFRMRDFSSLTTSKLEQLRQLRKEHSAPRNFELLGFWKARGEQALLEKLRREGIASHGDSRLILYGLP
jgi:hypothetical protein